MKLFQTTTREICKELPDLADDSKWVDAVRQYILLHEAREVSAARAKHQDYCTGDSSFKAKRIGYYSNFSKERFIEEMTAQTELGALNREYYALIARNLRTFYTIATSKFKRNSVLRRIRDMVVSNYNFIAKHASPLKSGTTIADGFVEPTEPQLRMTSLEEFSRALKYWSTKSTIDTDNVQRK
nr:hypothetical transcript [Hymenolepis microstoma]